MQEFFKKVLFCATFLGIFWYNTSHALIEHSSFNSRIFEDQIRDAINDILKNISEPLEIDNLTISNNEPSGLNGFVEILNLKESGITNYNLSTVSFSVVGLKAALVFGFPKIIVTADHLSDLELLGLLPVYGEGTFSVELDQLEIDIQTVVNISPIFLKNLNVTISLEQVKIDVTGLFYDDVYSRDFSKTISDLGTSLFHQPDSRAYIATIISPILQDAINELLADSNSTDIKQSVLNHLSSNSDVYKNMLFEQVVALKDSILNKYIN